MKKTALFAVACLLGAVTFSATSPAGLVLSLDARAPGASPTTQWQDLSGVNSPFTLGGDVSHLATEGAYEFGGSGNPGWATGALADESNFDFDFTDAFTVVVYGGFHPTLNPNRPTVSKGLAGGYGGPYWSTHAVDTTYNTRMDMGTGTALGLRDLVGSTDAKPALRERRLFVMHFPGSGGVSAPYEIYTGGSILNSAYIVNDWNGSGSALNDDPLAIGSPDGTMLPRIFELFFVEIYSGATIDNNLGSGLTPGDYSALRFANLGAQVIPEPATLLLGLMGAGLLWIRRRG